VHLSLVRPKVFRSSQRCHCTHSSSPDASSHLKHAAFIFKIFCPVVRIRAQRESTRSTVLRGRMGHLDEQLENHQSCVVYFEKNWIC
jgi:hypothetical protein